MKSPTKLLALISLAAALSGCAASLPFFPTATPTVTASPIPTKTLTPMPTPTETQTPEPTVTPEQLGGPEVAYLYDGRNIPMPEGVKALLTPSSPDTWNQTGWVFTDGTPYPWGKPIVTLQENNNLLVIVPSFL